jgi:integrase
VTPFVTQDAATLLLVTRRSATPKRQRGSIDELPSGAFRVRVHAGRDPLTGRRHDLTEVVPAGPRAAAEAEKVRTRLLNQVDERRNPRTRATMDQLLDRYLTVLDVGETTRQTYVGYIDKRIRPALGPLPAGRIDGETLDAFYAELRRCRDGCDGRRPKIGHHSAQPHKCDERCVSHVCKPLAASTIRQIHWILSGAFERAVRWHWIAVSPVSAAQPPAPPRPNPSPPSAADAARILTEAWKDPAWGTFLWVAMTTGARRGELCALRRADVDLDGAVLVVDESIHGRRTRGLTSKDTKSHQQRRIALDDATVAILREHITVQNKTAKHLDTRIAKDAYLFSLDPDCSTPLVPDSVSQRYDRLAGRLELDTTLHSLRHYNATELISAGVDLRTVAGRLGHGGGGTTTLRVYAAWVTEADQRAASTIAAKLPRASPARWKD